jgi:hypothetical protein
MTPLARRCMAALLLMVLGREQVYGQAAWEYTPYQARVWLALEPTPRLPSALVQSLGEAIPARVSAVWGAVLQVNVVAPPAKLRGRLLNDFDEISTDAVVAVSEKADLDADKLYLAALTSSDGAITIRLRELDCRSRQLGPVIEQSCTMLAALPATLCDALTESFTPLARIEQVDGGKMIARLRAAGLIVDPTSPALVEPGMVLRPVIRRNDRSGQPAKGGIQPIPWSFMTVDERRDSLLECTLRSGFRAAVPPRGGVRLERLALLVRPRHDSTRLILRSRSDDSKLLIGYEIHHRIPDREDTELLGTTDVHGSVVIPRGEGTLETLIVKSGKQLLARLPMVPGHDETLTAKIVDDDGRLAAEGFVAALSSRALDLVARREILAARIRARIKDGKPEEAQRLLDDFRRLETRAELNRDLDRFRQQVSASDKLTQSRIDKLFADAQRFLLLKPLSDELLAQLTREVGTVRTSSE